MSLGVAWRCVPFAELTLDDLYDLLALRAAVFVVEQECPYQDLDGLDRPALHLLGRREGALLAYARLHPPGVRFPAASVGRIVTAPAVRRTGLGRALMRQALGQVDARWAPVGVEIGAQRYLERFYGGFGFRTVGEPYDEDGIEHVWMVREPARA